jgi:Fibrinogen beta and gamma chains, C-terminal globular domain
LTSGVTLSDSANEYTTWYWAEYSSFPVSSESTGYILNVGVYSGNAGDAFKSSSTAGWRSNGMKFTTKDVDNDKNTIGNCVLMTPGSGGWWFNWCSVSLLNTDVTAVWTTRGTSPPYDVQQSRMMMKLI